MLFGLTMVNQHIATVGNKFIINSSFSGFTVSLCHAVFPEVRAKPLESVMQWTGITTQGL